MRSSDRMPTPSYTFVPPSRHIWEVDAGPDVTNEADAISHLSSPSVARSGEIRRAKTRQDVDVGLARPDPADQTRPRHALSQRVKRPMTSAALAMTDDDVFLRRREAAALVGVSTWKLDEWMRDYSDFPVKRLGPRTILINKRDYVDWLRNHNQWAVAPTPSKKPKRR